MARYYRNMAFYYLSGYEPETARACYQYSNVYYHTENADSELKYISEAIQQETPQTDIRAIQKLFDENRLSRDRIPRRLELYIRSVKFY